MNRRTFVTLVAAAGAASALAGCGFQLRRAPKLGFTRIALLGFPTGSALRLELVRAIEATGSTQVVDTGNEAQVVLRCNQDQRQQLVAATTAAAQVRELSLVTRLKFRVTTADQEKVLIPDTELAATRDMTYTETTALGKQQEAELLYRAMQADIVDQVMRRLAALTL